MRLVAAGAAVAIALAGTGLKAEDAADFTPAQLDAGRALYARNCSPCHGPRMQDPESAFDLRKFPRDQQARFVDAVTRGKNQMPPWGGLLAPAEIAALWAYVVAGEKR
jgi:mono/diheme cytochrome c family protein